MQTKTEIISTKHPQAINRAKDILQKGGLIAFPTDTVYGLAVPAFNAVGIDRLYQAKDREAGKAIPVLIGNFSQLSLITPGINKKSLHLARRFWPGALTLIVIRHLDLPCNISPFSTIGVRMPDHSFALALLKTSGPLATTSANISGETNPLTAQDVLTQLEGRIELILDGGNAPGGIPSTVVDCTGAKPIILRQGAIPEAALRQALEHI